MCKAVCWVCFHHCALANGQTGLCRARQNKDGTIVSTNYGKLTALALDPVEKKPLSMFYPGKMVLSAGSFGCNLNCPFCQNHSISCTADAPWQYVSPAALAQLADSERKRGNIGVAFTYNEPMIGYEYVRDTAKAVHELGMKNIVVTNGSVSAETLSEVLPYTDAFNIDLKGFTERWYRTLGGDLETVKAFITSAAEHAHVELTTLIVPGENDSVEEIRAICTFIAETNRDIPLHITRFFPRRRMLDKPPTDIALLYKLRDAAQELLPNVFVGNV